MLLAPACNVWSAPTDTIVVSGPPSLRAEIEAAVDVWASEGAAVAVGQIGPCVAGECLGTLGTQWRVRLVANHTVSPDGTPLCDGVEGDPVVFAETHYGEQEITIGGCTGRLTTAVIAHEIGHILLGPDHSATGVMVADQPKTAHPSHETLARACTLGWGC